MSKYLKLANGRFICTTDNKLIDIINGVQPVSLSGDFDNSSNTNGSSVELEEASNSTDTTNMQGYGL